MSKGSEWTYQWYQVEKIVGHREVQGKVEYRVHWSGYSAVHDSWEPENNLEGCEDLIQAYMDSKAAKTRRRSRKPPVADTSAVLLSSDDESKGSPKKARRGRPRKTQQAPATPSKVTTVSAATSSPAKGVYTYELRTRSASKRHTGDIDFSSDEESTPVKKKGPVKPRMTLSESKFRKQLTDNRVSMSLRKASTPNKNPPPTSTVHEPPVKTKLEFDTEQRTGLGVQTRSMALKQQKQKEEHSFIAEAPESEQDGGPSTIVPHKDEPGTYPAWPEVGWKEFTLAAVITALTAVGYVCYTTDLCKYC